MKLSIFIALFLSIIVKSKRPSDGSTCSTDQFPCPNGLFVSRDPYNYCQFSKCPNDCQQDQCLDPYGKCQESIVCFPNPCLNSTCNAAVSCESNWCGGCYAIFRDSFGNVIDPTDCDAVGCGINHCRSYNNGCNDCDCNSNDYVLCRLRPCIIGKMTKPHCTGCDDGYFLNATTYRCENLKECVSNCVGKYPPVCCSGKTYGSICHANCQKAIGCSQGACTYNIN
eukprot:522340_1